MRSGVQCEMATMSNPSTLKAVLPLPALEASGKAPTVVPTEDLALVQRSKRGDTSAYDELVRRYQERVYATIYHMTANHEDANDLAQETFIKGYQALKSFKGDSGFYTWAYRIAVNKTINFLKQRKNKIHLSLNDLDFNAENDPDLVALTSDRTPRRDAGLSELQEKLNAAMLKLSEVHRLVVTLHDVQGLSHEEIGKIMDRIEALQARRVTWRQRLGLDFDFKPAMIGAFGVGVCGLLLVGVLASSGVSQPS